MIFIGHQFGLWSWTHGSEFVAPVVTTTGLALEGCHGVSGLALQGCSSVSAKSLEGVQSPYTSAGGEC